MIYINTRRIFVGVFLGMLMVLGVFQARAGELEDATEMVAQFEGFRAAQYEDRGQKAIGFGTEVSRAKSYGYKGGKVTKEQATVFLKKAIIEEAAYLKKTVPSYGKLTINQKTALLSMSYNSRALVGPNLKSFIAKKDWKKATEEIAYGHNATLYGLIKRRCKEANTFAGKVVISDAVVARLRK